MRADRLPEAEVLYSKILALRPTELPALINRSKARNLTGKPRLALQDCNAALAIRPNLPIAYVNRAACLLNLGQPDRAKEDYERALLLDPESATARENLERLARDQAPGGKLHR